MIARKLTIVGVILLLSCMTVLGQSPSKFKIFVYSGMSLPAYPSSGFSSTYKPAPNIGVGLNYQLSSNISLSLDFNHYRFVPKEKWSWYMSWDGGLTFVKLENPFYVGDNVYEFNDLTVNLKVKPFQKRIAPYIILGGGASYRRNANSWTLNANNKEVFFTESIFYLVTTGLGFEYPINSRIDIFLEVGYNYCFFKNKKRNTGVTPLKIGIAWRL